MQSAVGRARERGRKATDGGDDPPIKHPKCVAGAWERGVSRAIARNLVIYRRNRRNARVIGEAILLHSVTCAPGNPFFIFSL